LPYIVPRMPRAFAAARNLVETLDQLALDTGKPINRRLAATALDNLQI
ncbi:MAG TPA: chromosomal replication initiator DnaA, partial [Roseovarius nubinhibens]|nr:chromosomal replication initiator DnaA [Roseovarius nubinhibens]